MKNREQDKRVQHLRNKRLVFERLQRTRQVPDRLQVLSVLLVQPRKVQRQPRLVVLRVHRRKQPLDLLDRVKELQPVTFFLWPFPQRLPERLMELRVDLELPVFAEVDSATAGLRFIRKARAENATPIAGDVRGRRRS